MNKYIKRFKDCKGIDTKTVVLTSGKVLTYEELYDKKWLKCAVEFETDFLIVLDLINEK